MKNGELLRRATSVFDVFVTADQNLEHQQNIASLPLAVVVLVASTNRMEAYMPLAKKLGEAVRAARPGTVTRVAAYRCVEADKVRAGHENRGPCSLYNAVLDGHQ